MMTRYQLAGLRLLVMVVCACVYVTAIPLHASAQSWHTHIDPRGYSIALPEGWHTSVTADRAIVAGPDEVPAAVMVSPFLLSSPVGAQALLQQMPLRIPGLYRAAHITRITRIHAPVDEAVATFSYLVNGVENRAEAMACAAGRTAMLYAIAFPQQKFEQTKPTLLKALFSLRFVPRGQGNTVGDAGLELVHLTYRTWTDPREGAFTVSIPTGWTPEGGLIRRNALDPRVHIDLVAPNKQAIVAIGDSALPGYIPPSPLLAMGGFSVGRNYSPGANITWVVMPFMTGTEAIRGYLPWKLTAPFTDLNVTDTADMPELAHSLQEISNRASYGIATYQFSVGRANFTCKLNAAPMVGTLYCTTVMFQSGQFKLWGAIPAGFVSTPAYAAKAAVALRTAVGSIRLNPQWVQRQAQTAMAVSRIATQSNQEIRSVINSTFAYKNQVHDTANRHWDNYILGQTDVRDSATGKTYTTDSNSNFYYLRNGTVKGSNEAQVDLTPLKEF